MYEALVKKKILHPNAVFTLDRMSLKNCVVRRVRFYSSGKNSSLRFGRPSNNLSSGIVGLANVGKSTFFQAITRSKLGNPANYPFATIKPEEAKVIVPSEKLHHLHALYQSQQKIPATLKIIDIAGLVRGASNGSGLGNQFLNDIRQVDGIFQVVRGFIDPEVTHVEGGVDPCRDLTIVLDELLLKDMEFVENALEKLSKTKNIKSLEAKLLESKKATLEKCYEWIMEGKRVADFGEWTQEDVDTLNSYNLLTAKPIVYLLNCSEEDYLRQDNQFLGQIKEWIQENSPGSPVILFSLSYETKLLENESVENSVLSSVIHQMRESLNLISFYTCGEKEARQWTIREGISAPEAASVIHTDLSKTFINAIVNKYQDLADLTPPFDEKVLKSTGKQLRVGKSYVVEDGDVILFKAAGAKTKR